MRYYLETEFDETEDCLVLLSLALRATPELRRGVDSFISNARFTK